MQYSVGDHVRCMWGSKPVEYEARILHTNSASKEYFVHYQGWNKRYDEWISEKSILGIAKKPSNSGCDTPKIRQSKREKKARKPVDWSPTPTSSRAAEKPVLEKTDCKRFICPVRVPKHKRSPVFKVVKQSRPQVSTVASDSAEESISSEEDDECTEFPRSYIDTLVKQKKREERKMQKRVSPKLQPADFIKSWKLSLPRNSTDTLPVDHLPIMEIDDSSAMSSLVSEFPSVECHSFSNIDEDHNYSSLLFYYSDAHSDVIGKELHAAQSFSIRRNNILPLRKPLDAQYKMPYSAPLKLYTEALSRRLSNHHTLHYPANLGTPFSYDDDYHSSFRATIECKNEVDVSSLVNQHVSDSSATSSSSSESGECSIDHAALAQKAVSAFGIAT